jgi:hypothetical protein
MKIKQIKKLDLKKSTVSNLNENHMESVMGGSGLKCVTIILPTDSCPDATCDKCITEDIWCEPTGTMC